MKISLSKAEMLERRRIAGGLGAIRTDCSIEYTDGIDVEKMLAGELRTRYLNMLDHAPLRYLAIENIMPVKIGGTAQGGLRMSLPDSCRRIVSVELDCWEGGVAVEPSSMYDTIVSRQYNDYRAATTLHPVAVMGSDGDLYVWPGGSVTALGCIVDHGEDSYVLDESGIGLLLSEDFKFMC